MRLAEGLEDHDLTRAALAEGRVHVEQAEAILRALADLPADLDPDLVDQAERHLLELAADHDAKALKTSAAGSSRSSTPRPPTPTKPPCWNARNATPQAATRLVMWDDGHGKVHGRFTVDSSLTGAMLKKALYAIAAPKHQASKGPLGERRPTPERLGHAFVELIQRYPTKRLPKAGGLNATAVVLMPIETLMGGLKAAHLDTGETISPGAARRLACEARIIPAVLGGKSQVLDLGRAKRFASEAQRIVKTIEAGGCEVEGCDCATRHDPHAPPDPLGRRRHKPTATDLIMICPPHHARAHDQRYTMTQLPTGKYTFHRRT